MLRRPRWVTPTAAAATGVPIRRIFVATLAPNFVIWGLIHGLALVFESTWLGRLMRHLWTPLQHAYALAVILVGWVFFRSPDPHFALVFLGRLMGDIRGVELLPFELTSPLPFIEPSFVLSLLAGVLFALPVGLWLPGILGRIPENRPMRKITLQVFSDLTLIFILIIAIAATTSATFAPGIYGAF